MKILNIILESEFVNKLSMWKISIMKSSLNFLKPGYQEFLTCTYKFMQII